MIRLKSIIKENIDSQKPFSLSQTDRWEYVQSKSGTWYTRKKGTPGTGNWINMEETLTPEKYDIAYRRIKDIVSGVKPGGYNTNTNI